MNRSHCDNCDVVLPNGPYQPGALRSKLKTGAYVVVESLFIHPVTKRKYELCAPCVRQILHDAVPIEVSADPGYAIEWP